MIKELVDRYMAPKNQDKLRAAFMAAHPEDYKAIVKMVIETVVDPDNVYGAYSPDPERIHVIDDGDYQGTLLFVIGAKGYQPSEYWFVKVYYGSCSGCDTLEAIRGYNNRLPSEEQVKGYMTLALHIIQGLKAMESED